MTDQTPGVGEPTPLNEYRFTFGVQYSHTPHPHWAGAHPDGWLSVLAPTEEAARRVVRRFIGNVYAFSYPKDRHDPSYYPLGELAQISTNAAGEVITSSANLGEPTFGPSDPEFYGRASTEVVAHRIEGKPVPGSEADWGGYKEIGYDAVTVHPECADEARGMFIEITEEDSRVLAFELDWADPHECSVCKRSIT